MSEKKFRLCIVAPTRKLIDKLVDRVIMRTADGDLAVLAGHTHLTVSLGYGAAKFTSDGEDEVYAVLGGYCEITPDKVTMLVDAAEHASEIDKERALAAKERAEKNLAEQRDEINLKRAELALRRALVRVEVNSYALTVSSSETPQSTRSE